MKAPFLLGRLIFGGFFIYSGIHHFMEYKTMAQYAKAKNIPMPEAAVLGTGAMLTLGGTSILLGAKPKLGALAILGFLAGTTPTMHDFWNDQDPAQKQNNMINFMKNVALLGGALTLMGIDEPWPASVQGSSEDEDREEVQAETDERPLRLSERRNSAAARPRRGPFKERPGQVPGFSALARYCGAVSAHSRGGFRQINPARVPSCVFSVQTTRKKDPRVPRNTVT